MLVALLAVIPDAGQASPFLDGGTGLSRFDGGFPTDAGEVVLDSDVADAGPVVTEVSLTPKLTVRIEGAKALPAEVYLEMLELPAGARADEKTAEEVRRQLHEFLLRTGFELANVDARVEDDGITVELDEGQIERIIFIGQLSFKLMSFKLGVFLPNDVFNRPMLDSQVRELSQKLGVSGVRWELVRTAEVEHVGPQVNKLPKQMDISVQREPVIHARRPYEVRIFLPEEAPGNRLGVELRSGYTDGIESGLTYARRDLLGKGDRLFASGSGGVGLRARIDTEKLYAHFWRSYASLGYDTAPLGVQGLTLSAWADGLWLARQRADLNLENYNALTVAGTLQLQYKPRAGQRWIVGTGFEWRRIFDLELAPGRELSPDVDIVDRKRPFLRLAHETTLPPFENRSDRRHTLLSDFRQYFPTPSEPGFGWADVRYQYVKAFGWHDFWVKGRGHLSWGDFTFHDEMPLGEFVHGLFGRHFVPSAVNLQLEFRFSLTRDLLKVGLFHDLALYAEPLRTQGIREARLANGFGPAVHVLVQDLFQLDMYVAFGFMRGAQFGTAFSMQLQKAF